MPNGRNLIGLMPGKLSAKFSQLNLNSPPLRGCISFVECSQRQGEDISPQFPSFQEYPLGYRFSHLIPSTVLTPPGCLLIGMWFHLNPSHLAQASICCSHTARRWQSCQQHLSQFRSQVHGGKHYHSFIPPGISSKFSFPVTMQPLLVCCLCTLVLRGLHGGYSPGSGWKKGSGSPDLCDSIILIPEL